MVSGLERVDCNCAYGASNCSSLDKYDVFCARNFELGFKSVTREVREENYDNDDNVDLAPAWNAYLRVRK